VRAPDFRLHRGVNEIFGLLRCYATFIDSYRLFMPTQQFHLHLGLLTLAEENDRLYRNVRN
jgi:hypothetical protein